MKRVVLSLLLFAGTMLHAQLPKFTSSQIPHLLDSAREGKRESQLDLGVAYQYGIGTNSDLQSAEYWLKVAAGYGDPRAQNQLGLLYLQPEYRDLHSEEARQWFLRAAAAEFAPAEHNLGLMYMRGFGGINNEEEALRWFRKAGNHGSLLSQVYAGVILARSSDPAKQKQAFQEIRQTAKRGEPKGMNYLAICYQTGRGTNQDMKKAIEWYKRAIDKGDTDAMHNLAVLYYKGEGVPEDRAEAFRLNSEGCDKGDPQSCRALAGAYMLGEGTEKSYARAYRFGLAGGMDDKFLNFVKAGLPEKTLQDAVLEAERWHREHAFELSALPQ